MIIQGLKRLSTPLPNSNHFIKRKESTYLVINSFLTDQNFFVFCEGTTEVGIYLNYEIFGMLYRNYINIVRRENRVRCASESTNI